MVNGHAVREGTGALRVEFGLDDATATKGDLRHGQKVQCLAGPNVDSARRGKAPLASANRPTTG